MTAQLEVRAPAAPAGNERALHIAALDGLRGIAVLLVMLHHSGGACAGRWGGASSAQIIFEAMRLGFCGVNLFFVLSGFLITRILLRTKSQPDYFRSFYARRVLRIFPLYYATLLVMSCVPKLAATMCTPGDTAYLWFYLSNIADTVQNKFLYHSVGHFWSLSVEEQFYLVFPLLVSLLTVSSLRKLCLGLFVGSLLMRFTMHAAGAYVSGIYEFTLCNLDALGLGALLATYDVAGGLRPVKRSGQLAIALAAAAGIAVFMLLGKQFMMVLIFAPTFLALLFMMAVKLAVANKTVFNSVLESKALRTMGKYSYGMYVFHFIVYGFLAKLWHRPMQTGDAIVYILGGFCITFAIAWLSYNFFERRFLALKKYC